MRRSLTVRRGGLAVLLAAVLAASGCGSDSGGSVESGLPDELQLEAVLSLSGIAGPGGQPSQKGMELAAKEISESGFLGDTVLKINFHDSKSDPATGASLMSKVAATKSPLVFGSHPGAVALAEAPVAQRAGVPVIFQQAGAKGTLEAGDKVFRATPLQVSYFDQTLAYLQANNVKRAAVIYDNDVPTIVDLYNAFKDGADKFGYEVVSEQATTSATVDVSSQVAKMLAEDPEAIFMNVVQAHNVQVIRQLRQAGFDGIVVAQQGAGGGTLKPAGGDAKGIVFTNDFNAGGEHEATQKFAKLYEDEYGEVPGNFAAEGYDAVWFAARALKEANSTDRADVLKALMSVGEAGFAGALGDITFKDRQQIIKSGVLVVLDENAVETAIQP